MPTFPDELYFSQAMFTGKVGLVHTSLRLHFSRNTEVRSLMTKDLILTTPKGHDPYLGGEARIHPSLKKYPDYAEQGDGETVPIDPRKPQDHFVHVHVCVHCGSAFRRENFEDRAQTTGIYPCPKCGAESPLNIEIRAVETLDKGSDTAE